MSYRLISLFALALSLGACAKAERPYDGPMPQVKAFFVARARAAFGTSSICYSAKVTGTTSSGASFVSVMTRPPGQRHYEPAYDQAGANDVIVRRRASGVESIVLKAPLKAGALPWKSPSDFTPLNGRENAEMTCRVTQITLQRPLKSHRDIPVVTVRCEAVSRDIRYTRTESFAQSIGTISDVYTESRPDGSQERTLVSEKISDFKAPVDCN